MFLVPLDRPDALSASRAPAQESQAIASAIAAVRTPGFGLSVLRALNTLLPLSWVSVYALHRNTPPEVHAGASYGIPDRTAEAFSFYRRGVYLNDRTFDDAKDTLQQGQAALSYWHAKEIPVPHRKGIYTRNGLEERASLVRKQDDGSLLAINFYRHATQNAFADKDIDLLCRVGEPLIACVNLHIQLMQEQAPTASLGPLHALPPRETDVCERLLRGWTHDGIAADLGISTGTVKTYRDRAFARLGIRHRNELFALMHAWTAQVHTLPPQ